LERQLVRIVMGTPASISESLNAAFLIAVEDLVAGLTRNPKLPAKFRHRSPASRRATNCSLSSITEHSFHGIASSLRGGSVTHVFRYDVLPMFPTAHFKIRGFLGD
jgi:hypothetical protein